jgi:hypothetical protein
VQESTRQRWLELCADAAVTEDPQRLEELAEAIVEILRQEKKLLESAQKTTHRATP